MAGITEEQADEIIDLLRDILDVFELIQLAQIYKKPPHFFFNPD